jgi:hypothetical protein
VPSRAHAIGVGRCDCDHSAWSGFDGRCEIDAQQRSQLGVELGRNAHRLAI